MTIINLTDLNKEQKWAMLGTSHQLCKSALSLEPEVEDEVVELAYFLDPPILEILEANHFYRQRLRSRSGAAENFQHNKNKVSLNNNFSSCFIRQQAPNPNPNNQTQAIRLN